MCIRYGGYSVFAPDFPAHSLSEGEALTSIELMAAWLVRALDTAKVDKVYLVGHSQGFLVALESAGSVYYTHLTLPTNLLVYVSVGACS